MADYNLLLGSSFFKKCFFFSSLSASDEENFCATVPKDGRSYSPTLFSQTVRVLKKINKPGDMIVAFGLLADKIKVWFGLENVCQETTQEYISVLWICVYWGGYRWKYWTSFLSFCFCFSPMQTDSSKKRRRIQMPQMSSWIQLCLLWCSILFFSLPPMSQLTAQL